MYKRNCELFFVIFLTDILLKLFCYIVAWKNVQRVIYDEKSVHNVLKNIGFVHIIVRKIIV